MLAEVVRAAASRFGDRPALVMVDGPSLSFSELDARSDRLAVTLARAHHLHEGDVVALRLPSHLGYAVAYAALAKLGVAAAGINPGLAAAEQDRILEHLRPTLVITDEVLTAASATAADLGEQPAAMGLDPERLAAVVFTSGTTGLPKGALFRNRHLSAIARLDLGAGPGAGLTEMLAQPDVPPPMSQLASTQFAHIGFMTKLPWYLAAGLTTHVLGRWRADDVIDLIERERIATLGAIAPQVALLLRSPRRASADLSCLRTLIVGGAASQPALVTEAVTELGVTYSIRYSSTESGGVGLSNDVTANDVTADNRHGDAIRSIGRPRPGVEANITEDGELCLRSAAVFDGYWNDASATDAAGRDGWLHTGDLAEFDDEGRVRLIGRRSDMYIRGGYNVHPAEVEAVFGDHPQVAQVVIVPQSDDVMGELGVAVIVPVDPIDPPTLEQLLEFAHDRLARWKHPEAVVIVDELPLTSVSKPDRSALRQLVLDRCVNSPLPDEQGSAG